MQAMRYGFLGAVGAALMVPTIAAADVATEVVQQGDLTITLYLHDFLSPSDLAVLRVIAQDKPSLAMFVKEGPGHAALAVSPDEGFIQGDQPAPAARALGGFPDADAARAAAIKACEAASAAKVQCLVILEVAPKA